MRCAPACASIVAGGECRRPGVSVVVGVHRMRDYRRLVYIFDLQKKARNKPGFFIS
jgi:hypothetical protein